MVGETTLDWYFDYVSAFAYLQFERLDRLPEGVKVRLRPVLFAGLLGHYGHLGPAEIPEKRRFTYRHWVWQAEKLGIPLCMPPAHPFNPLAALRLTLALGCDGAAVATIFRFIWREGENVEDADAWRRLCRRLGATDAEARIQAPEIKAALRDETAAAAARGVFGVPTIVVGEQLFWGLDATDMVLAYLDDRAMFEAGEMARVSALPVGSERRR